MPVPAPDLVLAAIAARTERLRLGSAVTVLSTDDPVRVYERFATLDALSGGRAEPILGRGSFTETFPLFGYDLADYDTLFAEKLELWSQLLTEGPVTWSGTTRPALDGLEVYPKTEGGALPTWVGVGGNPQSVVRVAQYGFNLMLAGLGMNLPRLTQYVDLFDRALAHFETPRPLLGLGVNAYVADTDRQARDELWPEYEVRMNRIGAERGWSGIDRASFEDSIDHGVQLIGSVDRVVDRAIELVRTLGLDRLSMSFDTMSLPLAQKTRSVRLLGEQVLPRVRAALATDASTAAEVRA